ncbi:MAG: PepSY-like domain-containing protein [Candidatus Acidiferrales bacterium]
MTRNALAPLLLLVCALPCGISRGQEKGSLKLGDLPPGAQVAVKEQSAGGTLRNLWVGSNKGEKVFGAVIVSGGKRKEVVVNADGKIVDVQQEVNVESLPPAMRKSLKEQPQGAKILNVSKETENGVVKYELETDVEGRSRNLSFDSTGKVTEIEEQVALDTLPAAARSKIEQQAGKGKVLSIEMVTTTGKPVLYEATIEVAGKRQEIRVAADGRLLPKDN